jgi:UDP-N-acetylglucosamine 1-carboxyvinyltransferase
MRRSVDIKTTPYPGFPTDLQPQFMALMTLAPGTSVITENVFENRFMHAHELKRMGANISLSNRNAIVTGVPTLSSAPVRVSDLRAGAALLLAALSTPGETILDDTERHIERGYEKIASKMGNLGAKLQFIKNGKTDSN